MVIKLNSTVDHDGKEFKYDIAGEQTSETKTPSQA